MLRLCLCKLPNRGSFLRLSSVTRYYTTQNKPADRDSQQSDAQKWRELRDQQRYSNKQWRPRKRLTRYEIDHLKILHRELPQENTIEKLAIKFSISQQAVRRILKSKFEPTPEIQERQDRKALAQKEERQNKWRMRTEEMEDKLAVK